MCALHQTLPPHCHSRRWFFDLVLQAGWVEHLRRCNHLLSVNNWIAKVLKQGNQYLIAQVDRRRLRLHCEAPTVNVVKHIVWTWADKQEAHSAKLPVLIKAKWRILSHPSAPCCFKSVKEYLISKPLSVAIILPVMPHIDHYKDVCKYQVQSYTKHPGH